VSASLLKPGALAQPRIAAMDFALRQKPETLDRRGISWFRLFWRHFLWIPLLGLLLAVVMGAFAWASLNTASILVANGVETSATVTRLQKGRSASGGTYTGRSTSWVHYGFQASDGQSIEGSAAVPRRYFDTLRLRDDVPVRYYEVDPRINAPVEAMTGFHGWVMAVGAPLLALLCFAAAAALLPPALSMRRAVMRGSERKAQVLALEPRHPGSEDNSLFRVVWTDPEGRGEQHSARYHPESGLPEIGATITVHVDPMNGRNWWEVEL